MAKTSFARISAPRVTLASLIAYVLLLAAPLSHAAAAVSHAAAATTSGAPTCGGELPAAKADGSQWTCTFDDEFNASTGDATALNTSWWAPQITATSGFTTGTSPNYVCYVNSSKNISVSGDALHLTVRKEAKARACGTYRTPYTGGMVSTYYGFHQTYGRYEIRALLPQATIAGLEEALWMYPASNTYGPWPASGEMDISESWSSAPNEAVPWLHYNFDPSTVDPTTHTNTYNAMCQIPQNQYNVYVMTWSPGNVTVTINGTTCMEDNYVPDGGLTSPQPFDQPFFIALTQGLDTGGKFDPATTPLPATLSIDYVRAWN
jgi:beta-glucanase (GH16 family)